MKFMHKYLSAQEVAELTQRIAQRIRIPAPETDELCAALAQRGSAPQYISDGFHQLWVEKLYIAYSTIDDPHVHYAYLTDKHIFEEDQSYQNAAHARKSLLNLPRYIRDEFKFALQIMIEDDTSYAILENV
jgi:hypothetical protein